MMNVLSTAIKDYHTITMKACREIRFSHGGHMFAAANGTGGSQIFNFYTGESPQNMVLKGHQGKVRCIDWFEDDMGLSDCGQDGFTLFYDLIRQKEDNVRLLDHDFNKRQVQFTGLCNIPGRTCEAIVVGNDRKVWVTSNQNNACDTRYNLSQVQILANGKAFFAGVSEEGHPGAVQIWKFPPEKLSEVQAHGAGIERMRISFDNNFLFTAGKDGCLYIHEVKDRDPRGGLIKREREAGAIMTFSDEILTEKSEMEEIKNTKESLN